MAEKLSESGFEVHFVNGVEKSLEEYYREDGGFLVASAKADDKIMHKNMRRYPGLVDTCFRLLKKHMKSVTAVSVYAINQGVKKLGKDQELMEKSREVYNQIIESGSYGVTVKPVRVDASRYFDETGGVDLRVLDEDLSQLDDIFQGALTTSQMSMMAFMAGIATSEEWVPGAIQVRLNDVFQEIKREYIDSKLTYKDFSIQ